MRPFEILLVVDNETMAQTLSTVLRRAGHRVIASTTIAGTVEALMRRGAFVDVIMTSTPFGSSLADDAAAYGRRFAAHARVISLHEPGAGSTAPLIALDDGDPGPPPAVAPHPPGPPPPAAGERARPRTDWN